MGKLNLQASQQAKLLDEWDAIIQHPSRRLTESEYRAAFKKGIITAEAYQGYLADLGYTPEDIAILAALYTK